MKDVFLYLTHFTFQTSASIFWSTFLIPCNAFLASKMVDIQFSCLDMCQTCLFVICRNIFLHLSFVKIFLPQHSWAELFCQLWSYAWKSCEQISDNSPIVSQEFRWIVQNLPKEFSLLFSKPSMNFHRCIRTRTEIFTVHKSRNEMGVHGVNIFYFMSSNAEYQVFVSNACFVFLAIFCLFALHKHFSPQCRKHHRQ